MEDGAGPGTVAPQAWQKKFTISAEEVDMGVRGLRCGADAPEGSLLVLLAWALFRFCLGQRSFSFLLFLFYFYPFLVSPMDDFPLNIA